jgi:hypothetical protein
VARSLYLLAILLCAAGDIYLYSAITASTVRVEPLPLAVGEATLIRLPGRAILIGAGADASVVRALGEALPPWERHLDALILLSSSAGEAGGAPYILEGYRTGVLLRRGVAGPAGREAALASALAAAHTPMRNIPPGAGLTLRYRSASLALSSSTPAGAYALR